MKTVKEYSHIVNNAIAALAYEEPASLYDPVRYTMEGQGKRLRPVLTLAVADAMQADVEKAVMPAVGVELYHNFTLLHDDIMDNSPTRRGRQAVWKRWSQAQAILSGDAMFSVAMDCMVHSGYSAGVRLSMIECFNSTALAVDRGQQFDMDFESRADVTLAEYIEMISLKTGALLAGACVVGAICGDASDSVRDAFRAYGINLGIAFQIQDDILDVYGNEATLGKPIGGDILNDKHTWLHIQAMTEDYAGMADVYDRGLAGDEKIAAVRAVYDRLSLREKAEREVERYLRYAIDALAGAGLSTDAGQFFVDFARSLIGRNK